MIKTSFALCAVLFVLLLAPFASAAASGVATPNLATATAGGGDPLKVSSDSQDFKATSGNGSSSTIDVVRTADDGTVLSFWYKEARWDWDPVEKRYDPMFPRRWEYMRFEYLSPGTYKFERMSAGHTQLDKGSAVVQ